MNGPCHGSLDHHFLRVLLKSLVTHRSHIKSPRPSHSPPHRHHSDQPRTRPLTTFQNCRAGEAAVELGETFVEGADKASETFALQQSRHHDKCLEEKREKRDGSYLGVRSLSPFAMRMSLDCLTGVLGWDWFDSGFPA